MKYATIALLILVVLEAIGAGIYLSGEAARTIPLVPTEKLADPTIMPQIEALAEQASNGTANDWRIYGEALIGKGFYAHAEPAFREALRQDPENFDAMFGLAFCLDRMGRMQESSVAYSKVVQAPSESPEQQIGQINALFAMGRNAQREDAPEDAQRYFQQNADYPAAEYQLAKLAIRSGHADKALPIIQKNLANIPYSLGFHFLDQRAQSELGNTVRAYLAAAMVERSAYLVSQNFNTNYVAPLDEGTGLSGRLSELHLAALDNDTSKVIEIAEAIDRDAADHNVFVADLAKSAQLKAYIQANDTEKALALIDQLREKGRIDAVTLEAEGDAKLQSGSAEEAVQLWQRAVQLSPSEALHQKLAKQLPERSDYHQSRAAMMKGLFEFRRNRIRSAIPQFEKAIQFDPTNGQAHFYLGEMYFYLDDLEPAAKAYRECLKQLPTHGRAIDRLKFLDSAESKTDSGT
ncbi:tetratricopeptide repeat protein [Bremerella cremea]|uniref:tetratricopeptide repeat protein n=1 Tax=Bremerella cremea TaxID=1031537 RepID=UPI0031E6FC78